MACSPAGTLALGDKIPSVPMQDLTEQQAALVRRKAQLREQKDGQYRQKYEVLQERMKELDKVCIFLSSPETALNGLPRCVCACVYCMSG